jgi:hypothetical protein
LCRDGWHKLTQGFCQFVIQDRVLRSGMSRLRNEYYYQALGSLHELQEKEW